MLMMMLMIMMMIMGLCRRSLQHPNRKTNLIKSNKKFFFLLSAVAETFCTIFFILTKKLSEVIIKGA